MDFESNLSNPNVCLFLDVFLPLAQTPDLSINAINCVGLRGCDDLLLPLNPGSYWLVPRLSTNLSSFASLLDQFLIKFSNLIRRVHRSGEPLDLDLLGTDRVADCPQFADTPFVKVEQLRVAGDCLKDRLGFF